MLNLFLKLLLLFTLSFGATSHAQIVNIQTALSGQIPTGINLQLNITSSRARGNFESNNFNVDTMSTFRSRKHLVLLMYKRDYGDYMGFQSAESYFSHARYAYLFTKRWSWEFFGQEDSDIFKRNKRRVMLGTGPRYQITFGNDLTLAGSIAYATESERFVPYEEFDDMGISTLYIDRDRSTTRYSVMGYFSYFFKEYVGFNVTAYFQPSIEDGGNYKTLYDASLLFGYSENVSMSFAYTHQFNSIPPYGVKRADSTLDQSLVLSWHISLKALSGPSETDMAKRRAKLRKAVKP